MNLRSIAATRYVTPLREGGSLPAVVEADDDGLYVLKFRGAGQGRKTLVAEVVAGELARALGAVAPELGLAVPELVVVELDPAIGRAEPDAEIQDLLLASAGANLGVDFLPGALPFRPPAGPAPSPQLAAVFPGVGPVNVATPVTLKGSGFQSGATVTIGGQTVPATFVTPTHSMLEPLVPPSEPRVVPTAVVVSRQPTATFRDLSV